MSLYALKAGDRVRVTVEGQVAQGCNCLWLRDAAGLNIVEIPTGPGHRSSYSPATIVSVEHVEPEWQAGDVVRTASGNLFCRTSCGPAPWRGVMSGAPFRDEELARPLTLLIRDGEAVTP